MQNNPPLFRPKFHISWQPAIDRYMYVYRIYIYIHTYTEIHVQYGFNVPKSSNYSYVYIYICLQQTSPVCIPSGGRGSCAASISRWIRGHLESSGDDLIIGPLKPWRNSSSLGKTLGKTIGKTIGKSMFEIEFSEKFERLGKENWEKHVFFQWMNGLLMRTAPLESVELDPTFKPPLFDCCCLIIFKASTISKRSPRWCRFSCHLRCCYFLGGNLKDMSHQNSCMSQYLMFKEDVAFRISSARPAAQLEHGITPNYSNFRR